MSRFITGAGYLDNSLSAAELKKIVTQARRVAEMMRSILNFVRQRPAQFGAINLARLVHETLELLDQ